MIRRAPGIALLLLVQTVVAPCAEGQQILDPTGRSGEPPPLLREEPAPPAPPVPILPAPPPPAPPAEPERLPHLRVLVREIRVEGSTVFTPEEIAKITAPYVGREVTAEDLEALRVALTRLYVDRGYVNSGAVLPDQTVTDGVIVYRIVEGHLSEINIEGNRWFRTGYLQRRIALGAEPPLNVESLQRQLRLLLDDDRLRRLNAQLKPGARPGEALLDVLVEEQFPYRLWIDVNNHQPPSVGAERGIVSVEHRNLTGNGDILTLRYGRSDGLDPLLDFRYALPFTARDTTLVLQYRRNDFVVVEEPFEVLDIESESEIYTATLRHPVYRTLSTQVALELTGERLSNETTLLGEPFTLSPGARRGRSVVTALRTAQEIVYRTATQVIAARSRFSLGVDAFGATVNAGDDPDGRFFSWLGQFQWVRRLPVLDSTVLFRTDVQLTPDPLLTLEQVAVGGRYSVRGYRENTLVRDNAVIASLEARVPLVRGRRWADFVELAPFVDYGNGWNTRRRTEDPRDLSSVGIGLRWGVTVPARVPVRALLEVYWGHALRNIETSSHNVQDDGLHFQLVLGAF